MFSRNTWRDTVKHSRILSLAFCFGVAFLLLAGSALAGTTTGLGTPTKYALQVGQAGAVYSITAGTYVDRLMNVARSQNFFIQLDLQSGFTFGASGLPLAGDVTLTVAGGGVIGSISIFSGGTAGSSAVRWQVPVTTAFSTAPTFRINPTTGWNIVDGSGYLSGTSTKYMEVTVTTYDVNTGTQFDGVSTVAADTARMIQAVDGVDSGIATLGAATINIVSPDLRKKFVVAGLVTATKDASSALKLQPKAGINGLTMAGYAFAAADQFTITFAGNLTGISSFVWAPGANVITKTVSSSDVTAGYVALVVPGNNGGLGASVAIAINVSGTTALDSRTLTAKVDTSIAANSANNNTELAAANLTAWTYNGTILIANYANTNTNSWRTRFYIWNPSGAQAPILVRVFTLPINGSASTLVGSAQLVYSYTVAAASGITIKLEDILTQLSVTMPYLGPDGNGNVYVEFAVGAASVTGWTQTFDLTAVNFMGMVQMHN